MIYGYARVSTVVQATTGNSLEWQHKKLTEAGAEEIFSEHFTGTTTERPKFQEVLGKLQPGDTLVVTKLDRFARTAAEGSKVIRDLIEKGIKVHILNIGMLENTPVGKVMVNVFLALAEFERDMIVERCQEGKRIARTKNGFHEGRPRINSTKVELALSLIDAGNSYRKVSEMTGISKATIGRYIQERKGKMQKLQGAPAAEM